MKYRITTTALFVAALVLYTASGTNIGATLGAFLFCAGFVCEISFWFRGFRGEANR